MHRRSLLAALAAAMLLASTLTAGVANAAVKFADQTDLQRAQTASRLRLGGVSNDEILKRTGLKKTGTTATKTFVVPSRSVRAAAGISAASSTNSSVTVESSFYYDTVNKKYNAYVDYYWNDLATLGDGTWWGGNVGGLVRQPGFVM